jgi:hypothetical protein|tara:strand:- start:159 stop:389 length:231 start_codon:yes stop_codon:yes gene_type:complete
MNGGEIIENNKKLINGDRKKRMLNQTKGTVQGAFTGLVAGVMYGYFKSKNIYTTGFVGMIIGGGISAILIGNFQKK